MPEVGAEKICRVSLDPAGFSVSSKLDCHRYWQVMHGQSGALPLAEKGSLLSVEMPGLAALYRICCRWQRQRG